MYGENIMKFFDKIIDKMIVKTPSVDTDRLMLEEFQKYEKFNNQRSKKILDVINKDMNKLRSSNLGIKYGEDMLNQTTSMIDQIKNFTGNSRYASSLAYTIDCARWYALYYMNSDKAREDQEIDKTTDRLVDIYDLIVLITLKYINRDRREKLSYKNNQFHGMLTEDGKTIMNFTASKTMALSELVYALRDQDNTGVFEAYNKLGETNLNQFTPSPFPEFE